MNIIDKMWEYACNGEIEALEGCYNDGCGVNNRYFRFGEYHSLIMGAFRNNQFKTVLYLLSQGEELTRKEHEEIEKELIRIDIMRLMVR